MNDAEIARLKAEAAQARAEAAQAKSEAAQAALDAALAASTDASETPTAEPDAAAEADTAQSAEPAETADAAAAPTASDDPVPAEDGKAEPAEGYAGEVRAGYSAEDSIQMGVYLDSEPHPDIPITIPLAMFPRHGLVAGATGTGKTRTLQYMSERLSAAGVPVFLTDIKGDLTGLAEPGTDSDKLRARTAAQGQDWEPRAYPTEFFTLGGVGSGIPIRATVTDFGPLLLAKVLGLNDTQESALSLIFSWSDAEDLALIDLADLRAVVSYLTDEGKEELKTIGGIAPATAGVILREIASLQAQGGDEFFGAPAFDPMDFLRLDGGAGVLSVLELPELGDRPALFSTFVMWLMAELFEILPEVGDVEVPKLVFFFDEAHLLFDGASKAFLDAVTRTVRLIRSKGVGIFFVTQTPKDIPDDVLAQLGARVQHALRAHTPNDQKALTQTVKTFPTSPIDLAQVLTSLGTGEAVVTVLDAKGRPSPVAPTRLWSPLANMGQAAESTVNKVVSGSSLAADYAERVDPESALELLTARMEKEEAAARAAEAEAEAAAARESEAKRAEKEAERLRKEADRARDREEKARQREAQQRSRQSSKAFDSFVRSASRTLGREITRSLFGNRRR